MLGLVLEGGGAKGSYQVGAYFALLELGYKFDYIVGTSIGALNGAMFAQGDEEIARDNWLNIRYSSVIDTDDEKMFRFINEDLSIKNFQEKLNMIGNILSEGGFDTTPFKHMLDQYIDEDRIRNSDIKFGLVTVDLSHFRPIEIFVDDMEEGTLKEYLYASANLPIFKQEPIRGRYFIDGGFYSNNPVKMLEGKCDKIVNILLNPDTKRPELKEDIELIVISPVEEITDSLNFNSEEAERGIRLGRFDAYKAVLNLLGKKYYVKPFGENNALNLIIDLYNVLDNKGETEYSLRKFLERWVHRYVIKERLVKDIDYSEIVVHMLEKICLELNIERFEIYSIEELSQKIYENSEFENLSDIFKIEKIMVKIINGVEI